MRTPREPQALTAHVVIDIVLRLTLIAVLAYACYRIARPFMPMLLWTVLLAIMLNPLHVWLRRHPRIGNAASAIIIGVAGTLLVLVPIVFATDSLIRSALRVVAYINEHGLAMPARPAWLERVPLIGKALRERWDAAAIDMPAALQQYRPQIRDAADWLRDFAAGLAGGLATTLAALILASILLAYGDPAQRFAATLMLRITGDRPRARAIVTLIASTVRAVVLGIVGVAFIQAVLVGIAFFAIGLTFAGALSLLALVMGILQIPVLLLTLPVIVYVFLHEPTSTAAVFAVWTFLAGMSDNFLRPFMLARGLDVPMPLILIGVIGGLIVDGMVGLFTGPVILSVAHVLFTEWLRERET